MPMIFDGKKFAADKEAELKVKFAALPRKIKLVTILDPDKNPSVTYTRLKKEMADRLGVDFEVIEEINFEKVSQIIQELNINQNVDGIMIQLPLIDRESDRKLAGFIERLKDVDAIGDRTDKVTAAARAVAEILKFALASRKEFMNNKDLRTGIVGAQGFVGIQIPYAIKDLKLGRKLMCYEKENDLSLDLWKCDIVISATGQASLIKPGMVKEGLIAIDVGFPKGDFDPAVASKASFFTPVPGGVGPVTVVMLFQNLLDSIHG